MRPVMKQVPVVVEAAHVAGLQEAVLVERFGGELGQAEVALHDVPAADANLAVLIGSQEASVWGPQCVPRRRVPVAPRNAP
jgi:hypothetical protein